MDKVCFIAKMRVFLHLCVGTWIGLPGDTAVSSVLPNTLVFLFVVIPPPVENVNVTERRATRLQLSWKELDVYVAYIYRVTYTAVWGNEKQVNPYTGSRPFPKYIKK